MVAEYVEAILMASQDQVRITTKEQSTWITKWKLAEEKSYNQGFRGEAISQLVGRAEMWKGVSQLQRGSVGGVPMEKHRISTPSQDPQSRAPEVPT